jgi:hypothetical protein
MALRLGVPFWGALSAGCGLTFCLDLVTIWIGPRLGLKL